LDGAAIRRVQRTGRRTRRTHLEILWATSEFPFPRLGVIVPRLGRTAVARNRLRRRLKELWRKELQHSLPALDVVIRSRAEGYSASLAALREELLAWAESQPRPSGREDSTP
jgi:ribonuclease P protein component